MGYLHLGLFLGLQRAGSLKSGSTLLDLGTQEFTVRDEAEFVVLKADMDKFVGRSLQLSPKDFIGYIPASKVFSAMGIDYCCIDVDGKYNSTYMDLNFRGVLPSFRRRFDVIMNQGTSEHLLNQGNCYANVHDMLKVGGVFASNTPFLGWHDHGMVNMTLKFWRNLLLFNDYSPLWMAINPPQAQGQAGRLLPDRMGEVINIEMIPDTNSNFHIAFRKESNEPFILPVDAISDNTDLEWTRKIVLASLTQFYVNTGLMQEIDIALAADKAINRLKAKLQ